MLDALSRRIFLALADSRVLERAAARYGMRGRHAAARRFIGGRTIEEAIDAARALERQGLAHTFNHLGEHVRTPAAADAAARAYLAVIDAVCGAGLACHLSVKLTQLGIELDPALARAHLDRILARADARESFVRIDMEQSTLVDATLDAAEAMRAAGHARLGVVLQSALRRTPRDLARVAALGLPVRLVKGAYREPAAVAYPVKADVDRAYVQLAEALLDTGVHAAFATHDPRMLDAACALAARRGTPRGRFEFQMLFGVRRDLQAALAAQGYGVRIYLPFGSDWFPYFMRRLAERPANVAFVVRSLLYEQLGDRRRFGG